jgi:V8-like Glu-specific endopeptidase
LQLFSIVRRWIAMLRQRLSLLTALVIGASGCVGVIPPDDEASQPQEIVRGDVVDSPNTPFRRFIYYTCGATKIDSHLLLTAGHCVLANYNDPKGPLNSAGIHGFNPGQSFQVDRGNNNKGTMQRLTVAETTVYPYMRQDGGEGDLAIIRTAEEIAGPTATIGGAPWSGKPITIMGVGCTGKGGGSDGILRKNVDSKCTRVDSSQTFDAKVSGSRLSPACEGDSGGPAFVTEGNTQLLVGIVISGQDGRDGFGVRMIRLDHPDIAKWISNMRPQVAATPVAPADYPAVLGLRECSGVKVADTLIVTSSTCVQRAGVVVGQMLTVGRPSETAVVEVKRLFPFDRPAKNGWTEDVVMIETEERIPIGDAISLLTSRALTSGENVQLVGAAAPGYALKKLDVVLAPDEQYPSELLGVAQCPAAREHIGAGAFQRLPSGESILVGIGVGCGWSDRSNRYLFTFTYDIAEWLDRVAATVYGSPE